LRALREIYLPELNPDSCLGGTWAARSERAKPAYLFRDCSCDFVDRTH